mgnify:CR=1 FL=1|jgi:hypothetical protein
MSYLIMERHKKDKLVRHSSVVQMILKNRVWNDRQGHIGIEHKP